MQETLQETLLSEKYRPRRIEDCILPKPLKDLFQNIVASDELPNLLLTGTSGLGKTTVARALCEEMGLEVLFINASEDNGIDLLRTTIRDFGSTVSFDGAKKVIILDEADNMSHQLQQGLRGAIQDFSKTCKFILTCNYKNKIIPAIQSRTVHVEFKFEGQESQQIAAKFFARVVDILELEGVEYDKKVVAEFIKNYFPDFRRTLDELKRHIIQNGKVDIGILSKTEGVLVAGLIESLKKKDFRTCRQWIVDNADIEPIVVVRYLYDNMVPLVKDPANLILILADCQKHLPWVVDTEIHLAATFIEIMGSAAFKDV